MKTLESVSITEINIVPVKPQGGLLGFASFVINESFYVSSVAVHGRLGGGVRLVYPRIKGVDVFHPIEKSIGTAIEDAIEKYYLELMHL